MTERRWSPKPNGIPVPYAATVSDLKTLATRVSAERWTAFPALARSSDREALTVLTEFLSSPDPHVRRRSGKPMVPNAIPCAPVRDALDSVNALSA